MDQSRLEELISNDHMAGFGAMSSCRPHERMTLSCGRPYVDDRFGQIFLSGFGVKSNQLTDIDSLSYFFSAPTSTMALQEQAIQSGLVFCDGDTHHVPPWNANDWPPLLGGWRFCHASVVLNHPDKVKAQTVVVTGGRTQNKDITNSVLVLNLGEENKQWQEGPPLNECRREHAAVVCNGGVNIMGGLSGKSASDSIERIDVVDMLEASRTKNLSQHWTRLNCRMTSPRCGCSAVEVGNRYIVIMGGYNRSPLSTVDIVDTSLQSNHTVIPGPFMTVARARCTSTVVGHRIFVVGGHSGKTVLTSVESLEFDQPSNTDTKKTGASTVFPSSSAWTRNSDLVLSVARYTHAAARVGSCIIVAGSNSGSTIVEVMDTERNIVWNLPQLVVDRIGCSIVAVFNGITVISGEGEDTCEILPLFDRKEQLKVRTMHLIQDVYSIVFMQQSMPLSSWFFFAI